eukprot:IDg9420t1
MLSHSNREKESVSTFKEPVESSFHSARDMDSLISQSLQDAPPDPYSELYVLHQPIRLESGSHGYAQDGPNK